MRPTGTKDKIIIGLVFFIIALICFGLFIFTKTVEKYNDNLGPFISEAVKINVQHEFSLIKLPSNGVTPVYGIDYRSGVDGITPNCMLQATKCQGVAGKDSISTTTTIVQEVPVNGKDGKDGEKAPRQETRFNNNTGDVETKYEDEVFWNVLIPCDKLHTCPLVDDTVEKVGL